MDTIFGPLNELKIVLDLAYDNEDLENFLKFKSVNIDVNEIYTFTRIKQV